MQDQYKLTQLEDRINKVCTDFNLLKESISWLPIIIMICFLSGLIMGLLIGASYKCKYSPFLHMSKFSCAENVFLFNEKGLH